MKNLLKISLISITLSGAISASADNVTPTVQGDTIFNPDIIYSPIPKSYVIAGINVEGINHVDDYVIVANSGLSIGERVNIPGDAITAATKRLWRQGLYSRVNITADKIYGDQIWLTIHLRQQPRMSEMRFTGAKGGEKKTSPNASQWWKDNRSRPTSWHAQRKSSKTTMEPRGSRTPWSTSVRCRTFRKKTK